MKNTLLLISSLSLSAVSFSQNEDTLADASAKLDTVKVSADFRQLDLMQIPSAITVVDAQAIENRNADHLESILSLAPNVNFAAGSSRGRYFQIRGIGERSQFIDSVNPSVGLIIDGIDMTGLGGAATLFDVEQVEILRGPQGTTFGANALAGAINIKSKQPTKETEGYLEAKAGNYNSQGLGGAISGSLSDSVQTRFAINQFKTDGYINNIHLNKDDTNNIDETIARGQLNWQINSNNDLNISLLKTDINNGYDTFSLDNTRKTYSDQPGKDTQETTASNITWSNSSLETATLMIQINASESDAIYSYDEDWSFPEIDPRSYSNTDEYIRNFKRNSIETRASSNNNSRIFNESTNWTLGAYQNSKEESLLRNYNGVFSNLVKQSSIANYIELTTTISPITTLTSGIRIERYEIKYSDTNNIFEQLNETLWGGKATVDHMLSPLHIGYLSIARGYKSGGINSDPDVTESNRTFSTEINNSIELGLKSSTLNDTLTTRVAAFYTQRKDQQVKSSYPIRNPNQSTSFQDYLTNAAEGKNMGIEFESTWKISNNIDWLTSVGYLNTEFTDYSYENTDGIQSKDGHDQAHAPEWSASTSFNLATNEHWIFSIEAEGKDSFYYSDNHETKSKAYGLIHTKIKFTQQAFTASLNIRNITDKKYSNRALNFGEYGNDPRNGYTPEPYFQFGDPRLISLSARYNF